MWLGGFGRFRKVPGKTYYSKEALATGMELYNEALLRTCEMRGVECHDVARDVAKDTSSFYDDLHFNEGGAIQVAESLADYLLSQPPFGVPSYGAKQ